MKIKSLFVTFSVFFFIAASCSKDENLAQKSDVGIVKGKLLVKNGSKPVGGALVFVLDDENKLHFTYTLANGDYNLKVPIGNRILQFQTGNGSNFRTTIPIKVARNQTITVDNSLSRLNQVANMAYVDGDFDEIQDIVVGLGYSITQITNSDLANYLTISQYDILFLNCGAKQTSSNDAIIDANLAQFVTNGGSLYASDYAVAYLTGGSVNSQNCGEAGGFIPDSKLCTKNNGTATTINGAQVSNSSLAAALGFTSLNIQYNIGLWDKIFSYDAAYWEVMISDPSSNQPLMIKTTNFTSGIVSTPVGGNVNDGLVTICHTDESANLITITIDDSDLPAHQQHGDSLGSCNSTNNSGTIYYTTFHNHTNGNIGNAGLILEYVILNL